MAEHELRRWVNFDNGSVKQTVPPRPRVHPGTGPRPDVGARFATAGGDAVGTVVHTHVENGWLLDYGDGHRSRPMYGAPAPWLVLQDADAGDAGRRDAGAGG